MFLRDPALTFPLSISSLRPALLLYLVNVLGTDASLQTTGNVNHYVSIGLNFGILLLCIYPTWIVLSELERSHEIRKVDEDVSEGSDAGNEEKQVK